MIMKYIKFFKTESHKLLVSLLMVCGLVAFFSCEEKIDSADAIEESTLKSVDSLDKEEDLVYSEADNMPEFPGGQEALIDYVKNELEYPVEARTAGIEGKVVISFVVEKDGSVGRAKILSGVDKLLDSEALRVVSNLPKWKPGKQDGEIVAVSYVLPISFKLQ